MSAASTLKEGSSHLEKCLWIFHRGCFSIPPRCSLAKRSHFLQAHPVVYSSVLHSRIVVWRRERSVRRRNCIRLFIIVEGAPRGMREEKRAAAALKRTLNLRKNMCSMVAGAHNQKLQAEQKENAPDENCTTVCCTAVNKYIIVIRCKFSGDCCVSGELIDFGENQGGARDDSQAKLTSVRVCTRAGGAL